MRQAWSIVIGAEESSFFVDYVVLLGLHHEKGNVLEWSFPDVPLTAYLQLPASSVATVAVPISVAGAVQGSCRLAKSDIDRHTGRR